MSTRRLLPMSSSFNRREFLALGASVPLGLHLAYGNAPNPPQTDGATRLHPSASPAWVKNGIVAASNMEALSFVRRRGGQEADYAEQWRAYLSDAAISTLRAQGINVIIMSLYKGAGLK